MEKQKVTVKKAFELQLWSKCSVFLADNKIKNITQKDEQFTLSFWYFRPNLKDSTVSSDTILEYYPRQLLWSDEPIDRTEGHKGLQEIFLEITGQSFNPSNALKIEEDGPDTTYYFENYEVDCCPDGDYIYYKITSLDHLYPTSK